MVEPNLLFEALSNLEKDREPTMMGVPFLRCHFFVKSVAARLTGSGFSC